MPLVIFLRHGQAKNNVERILAGRAKGFPLTDQGIQQAEQIGNFLKSFNVSKIYCSPVERAEHTARIVADKVGLNHTIDERLTEIEMGSFSGMHYDDMLKKHGNVFLKFYQNHPIVEENGIETFSSVKNRILDMVSHCSKKHEGETVLLVTHMDPIKSMISTVLQPRPESLYEMIIRNASLTILKNEQSSFSMVAINSMNPERYSDE
ncbi:MAG: histidine phosphatase family protein [Nitrosotalea sp.]